ncbi:MAG: hypothetical protein ABIJ34_04165, partial [archaeon]
MKEKNLLINPSWEYVTEEGKRYNRVWPPLDLLYIATALNAKGIQSEILDLNAEKVKIHNLEKIAQKFDKIFITTSSLDRWQCTNLKIDNVEFIINKLQNKKIIILGYHGTVFPEHFLKHINVEVV